jgi:hypothetical protein
LHIEIQGQTQHLHSLIPSVNIAAINWRKTWLFPLPSYLINLAGGSKMKSLKDILAILVGIASAIGAIVYFYWFVTDPNPAGGHTSGWIALGLAAVAFICGLIYFLGHVNKEEEIHITQ